MKQNFPKYISIWVFNEITKEYNENVYENNEKGIKDLTFRLIQEFSSKDTNIKITASNK